jgi:DUF1680 family protein
MRWIEAASYSLVWHPDPGLEKTLDDAIDIVCNAQQEDGYLSNPHVRENIGKIAVMRGPIVYCAEEEDNGNELFRLHVGKPNDINIRHEKNLLRNVTVIFFTGKREKDWDCDALYQTAGTAFEDKKIILIPYYAWANRKAGEMTVWLNE